MEDKELKLITTRYPDGTPHAQYLASDLIKIANQYASQYRDWAIQDMSPEEWDRQYSNALSALIDGRLVKFPDGYRFTDGSTEKIHRNVLGTLTAYLSALDEYTPEEKELPSNAELFSEYVAKPLALDNPDEIKNYMPGGIHHSQAGTIISKYIKDGIFPKVKGTDREQFWNGFVTELENGIGDADVSFANRLGDRSSGQFLKAILGKKENHHEKRLQELKQNFINQGLTEEKAGQLAVQLVDAQNRSNISKVEDLLSQLKAEQEERNRKIALEAEIKEYNSYGNNKWLSNGRTFTESYDPNNTEQLPANENTRKIKKAVARYLAGGYKKQLTSDQQIQFVDVVTKQVSDVGTIDSNTLNQYINNLVRSGNFFTEQITTGNKKLFTSPASINAVTGELTIYDSDTNQIYRTSVKDLLNLYPNSISSDFYKILFNLWRKQYKKTETYNFMPKSKYGSKLEQLKVLKYQNGGDTLQIQANPYEYLNDFNGLYEPIEVADSEQRINTLLNDKEANLSPEEKERLIQERARLQEKIKLDQLKWYEILRGVGTAFDVMGAAVSFVPAVNTLVAPALGAIGTAAHTVADYNDDSLSEEERKKRLALNVGLTAALAIPGGGSLRTASTLAKTGSKAKAAAQAAGATWKWAKRAGLTGFTGAGLAHSWNNKEKYWNDVSDVVSGEGTYEQLRDLFYNTSIFAGSTQGVQNLSHMTGAHFREAGHPNISYAFNRLAMPFSGSNARIASLKLPRANTTTGYGIRTDKGEVAIAESVYKQLVGAMGDYATKHKSILKSRKAFNEGLTYETQKLIDELSLKVTTKELDKLKAILGQNDLPESFELQGTSFGNDIKLKLDKTDLKNLQGYTDDFELIDIIKNQKNLNYEISQDNIKNLLITAVQHGDVDLNSTGTREAYKKIEETPGLQQSFGLRNYGFSAGLKTRLIRKMNSALGTDLYGANLKDDDYIALLKYMMQKTNMGESESTVDLYNKADNIISNYRNNGNNIDEAISYIRLQKLQGMNTQRNVLQTKRDEVYQKILKIPTDENNYVLKPYIKAYDKLKTEYDRLGKDISKLDESIKTYSNEYNIQSNRLGGTLNKLKQLRSTNFTTDTTKKFSKGGIIKARQGEVLNTEDEEEFDNWYTRLWTHKKLKGWDSNKDKSHAGNLSKTKYHNKSGDIDAVYKFNNEYINSGKVGEDIQAYYDSLNNESITPEEFVQNYNNLLKTVNDRFNNEVTYGTLGAKAGNEAHKQLFNSQYNPNNQNIYLSWNPRILDTWGTTSWLRRGDRYEKELNELSSEELAKRTFDVTTKNGSFKVYKKANGELTLQVEPEKKSDVDDKEETPQYGNLLSDQIERDGTDGNLENDYKPQQTVLEDYYFDPYAIGLQKAYPELLDISRYLKNLRNNQRVLELGLKKRINLKAPLQLHRNTYGDFDALMQSQKFANQLRSKADDIAGNTINTESGAAAQLDAELKAQQQEMTGRDRDNQMMRQSANESQQMAENLYKYNKEIGEQNMDKIVAHENYKLDLKAAKDSADTTNYNSFSMGKEQRARQDAADLKEKIEKIRMLRLEQDKREYLTNTPKIQQLYKQLYATTDPDKRMKILDQIEQLKHEYQRAYGPYFFDEYIRILLGDYSRGRLPSEVQVRTPQPTITKKTKTNKKGGKLYNHDIKKRGEDLKELRKQIRHNITTNQKALDNLSKVTLLELKKMMDI